MIGNKSKIDLDHFSPSPSPSPLRHSYGVGAPVGGVGDGGRVGGEVVDVTGGGVDVGPMGVIIRIQ